MKHYVVSINEAIIFLKDHLQSRAKNVEALNGGDWSAAYAYVLESKEYVIRFAATDEDFKKDQKVGNYATPKLHVPKIVEIGEALRGYFAISERNHGIFLDDLDGEQMRRTLPSLLSSLDEIREIDLSDTEGYGWWEVKGVASCSTWQEPLISGFEDKPSDRTYGWRKKLESSPTGAAAFDRIRAMLETLVVDLPGDRYVIHNDLLYRNVLVEDSHISVIIDWGNSMYGDFLYDIALLIYYWSWFPKWKDIDIKQAVFTHYKSIGLKVPDIEKRLLSYQIHIGLDGIKYAAFTENWDHLKRKTEQTLNLLKSLE
jgi:hygromycin-B 4-O-kinase